MPLSKNEIHILSSCLSSASILMISLQGFLPEKRETKSITNGLKTVIYFFFGSFYSLEHLKRQKCFREGQLICLGAPLCPSRKPALLAYNFPALEYNFKLCRDHRSPFIVTFLEKYSNIPLSWYIHKLVRKLFEKTAVSVEKLPSDISTLLMAHMSCRVLIAQTV